MCLLIPFFAVHCVHNWLEDPTAGASKHESGAPATFVLRWMGPASESFCERAPFERSRVTRSLTLPSGRHRATGLGLDNTYPKANVIEKLEKLHSRLY